MRGPRRPRVPRLRDHRPARTTTSTTGRGKRASTARSVCECPRTSSGRSAPLPPPREADPPPGAARTMRRSASWRSSRRSTGAWRSTTAGLQPPPPQPAALGHGAVAGPDAGAQAAAQRLPGLRPLRHHASQTPRGPRKGLEVRVEREASRRWWHTGAASPCAAQRCGPRRPAPPRSGTPAQRCSNGSSRTPASSAAHGTASRSTTCAHLKDLQRPGRAARPAWVEKMAARQRKTLVVCHDCHVAIHAGRPRGARATGMRHWRAGCRKWPARFGGGPSEKARARGTSPAAYPTSSSPRGCWPSSAPCAPGRSQPRPLFQRLRLRAAAPAGGAAPRHRHRARRDRGARGRPLRGRPGVLRRAWTGSGNQRVVDLEATRRGTASSSSAGVTTGDPPRLVGFRRMALEEDRER